MSDFTLDHFPKIILKYFAVLLIVLSILFNLLGFKQLADKTYNDFNQVVAVYANKLMKLPTLILKSTQDAINNSK